MSSIPNNADAKISQRRTGRRRRRTTATRGRRHAGACKARPRVVDGQKVSDKLEALKNLIPAAHNGSEIVKADQLFQETADYIVLLRNQVVILQRLIEFYGSSERENNVVL